MQAPLQLTVRPRSIILILFCALVAAGQLAAQFSLDDLIFEPVATGLERPISIAHAGDGSGRLFIVLQAGGSLCTTVSNWSTNSFSIFLTR